MTARTPWPPGRLDDAARAGWLYYVAGNTQDEIARKLGVSRQSAQRLVAMAVSEGLVKVRLDHPIGRCMDLAQALRDRYGLAVCEVAPADPEAPASVVGAANVAAALLAQTLRRPEPQIVALGTGRALRATVEALPSMSCPQHRLVSLLGNMDSEGQATPYNATVHLADRVGAPHYPYPLPVLARDPGELRVLHVLAPIRKTLELSAAADLTLVGVGQMAPDAPIVVDGFVDRPTMARLRDQGAVGEITSWVYDATGQLVDCEHNRRVASAPLRPADARLRVGVVVGDAKLEATRAALAGRLMNGLATNEALAARLLDRAAT